MKAYRTQDMYLVMFHNDQDRVPGPVAAFVRDSFNAEVANRLDRYRQDLPGSILALIFTGDSVFFHSQPFDASPPPLQGLVARPFGLKPTPEAAFAPFDRFLVQTDAFIHGVGDSMVDLALAWQHFSDFVTENATLARNEWADGAGFEASGAGRRPSA